MAAPDRWLGPRIDRRQFLALTGAVVVAGCAPAPPAPSAPTPPAPTPTPTAAPTEAPAGAFDALRRLRSIVQRSPDHLGTLAAAAVATGDPAAVVGFVRDHVAILPGSPDRADPVTEARWGARGTLASGRGTLRERADLVVELLGAMGVTGAVMSMPRPADFAFGGPVPAPFTPDPTALEALWDTIDAGHPRVTSDPDAAPAAAASAASTVLAALPAELRTARTMAAGLPERIPVVAFGEGAEAQWATAAGASPLLATAPDGLLGASAAETPQVIVSVQVALNPPSGATVDRATLHEVLRGTWPADQLAARHLTLAFGVPGSPTEALQRRRSEVPVRQPVLRLEALDADASTTQIVGGVAISLAGGLITPAADGSDALDGPTGTMLARPNPGVSPASVATIGAAVSAAAFPTIDLDVRTLDAGGQPVDGLPAAAFAVTEDGSARAVTVIRNSAPSDIRILVIYDASGSVADFWPTSAARAAFESGIAGALVTAATSHPFKVQVIGIGGAARDDAWVEPGADSLGAAFAAVGPSTSDIWTTLGRAVPASGASAAVLVSDNAASDLPDEIPGLRRQLRAAAAPVAVLPVGKVDQAATDAIVADTRGQRFDPRAAGLAESLAGFVAERVAAAASTGYRLRYTATEDGPASRAVAVAIGGSAAGPATLTYRVPSAAERSAPSGVAGVYVTITVGDRVMRRRLGGVPASDRDVPADTADAAAIAEATAALDSIHTIRFDPGTTTARLLDDLIGAALTFEPLGAAWSGGPAAIAAASTGWRRFPGLLAAVCEPVAGDQAIDATPGGLAVTVLTEAPTAAGQVHLSDVVPGLGDWLGRGPDAAAAFDAAARRSVGASIREALVFPASAADQLDGLPLTAIPSLSTIDSAPLSDARKASLARLVGQYPDFHRLVPTSGEVVAAWLVDPDTGSLTAVGDDGRGAGKDYSKCLMPKDSGELETFIATSIAMISMLCIATPGVITQYACVGSDVYGAATAALGSFTSPPNIGQDIFNAASYAAGLAAADVEGLAGRAIIAVLLMMAGMVAGGACA
ncbi:MAG TPA: hypothetical protein VGK16_01890 [Candidatus Limnocylindrales bacterium]